MVKSTKQKFIESFVESDLFKEDFYFQAGGTITLSARDIYNFAVDNSPEAARRLKNSKTFNDLLLNKPDTKITMDPVAGSFRVASGDKVGLGQNESQIRLQGIGKGYNKTSKALGQLTDTEEELSALKQLEKDRAKQDTQTPASDNVSQQKNQQKDIQDDDTDATKGTQQEGQEGQEDDAQKGGQEQESAPEQQTGTGQEQEKKKIDEATLKKNRAMQKQLHDNLLALKQQHLNDPEKLKKINAAIKEYEESSYDGTSWDGNPGKGTEKAKQFYKDMVSGESGSDAGSEESAAQKEETKGTQDNQQGSGDDEVPNEDQTQITQQNDKEKKSTQEIVADIVERDKQRLQDDEQITKSPEELPKSEEGAAVNILDTIPYKDSYVNLDKKFNELEKKVLDARYNYNRFARTSEAKKYQQDLANYTKQLEQVKNVKKARDYVAEELGFLNQMAKSDSLTSAEQTRVQNFKDYLESVGPKNALINYFDIDALKKHPILKGDEVQVPNNSVASMRAGGVLKILEEGGTVPKYQFGKFSIPRISPGYSVSTQPITSPSAEYVKNYKTMEDMQSKMNNLPPTPTTLSKTYTPTRVKPRRKTLSGSIDFTSKNLIDNKFDPSRGMSIPLQMKGVTEKIDVNVPKTLAVRPTGSTKVTRGTGDMRQTGDVNQKMISPKTYDKLPKSRAGFAEKAMNLATAILNRPKIKTELPDFRERFVMPEQTLDTSGAERKQAEGVRRAIRNNRSSDPTMNALVALQASSSAADRLADIEMQKAQFKQKEQARVQQEKDANQQAKTQFMNELKVARNRQRELDAKQKQDIFNRAAGLAKDLVIRGGQTKEDVAYNENLAEEYEKDRIENMQAEAMVERNRAKSKYDTFDSDMQRLVPNWSTAVTDTERKDLLQKYDAANPGSNKLGEYKEKRDALQEATLIMQAPDAFYKMSPKEQVQRRFNYQYGAKNPLARLIYEGMNPNVKFKKGGVLDVTIEDADNKAKIKKARIAAEAKMYAAGKRAQVELAKIEALIDSKFVKHFVGQADRKNKKAQMIQKDLNELIKSITDAPLRPKR